jgi:hypothetical protein
VLPSCSAHRRVKPEIEKFAPCSLRAEGVEGRRIMVDLFVKPNDSVGRLYKAGIDQIDNHVEEKYDRVGLAEVLAHGGE